MRSESIHPVQLGGTLFVPATHPQLIAVASGEKYPALRSMVIDLEDGIDSDALPAALDAIAALLRQRQPTSLLRFIRPACAEMLTTLLDMNGIERIHGFVLPKFGLDNADAWLLPLREKTFAFMPSIEGSELFSFQALQELADMLKPHRCRIPSIRFGLEDMLRQLGIARDCKTPLYDLVAPAQVIATLITVFKPLGFNISGGVYKCFQDSEGFRAEVENDLKQGLLGKTIIHPSQISIVDDAYKVSKREKAQAEKIVNASSSISSVHGMMLEKTTQIPWAETILQRAAFYGVRA